ncbi:hypothetical protein AWM75_06870 [Aerococcus urinaehominis]|uniref:Uncharacterized protein n=1 Tax=Aerococcus urinaehominis TaxID=128944 RepID=A0A0X8FLW1_9LACT|nr:MarR family transcriptional regulator [Aerococcus urinaehominis]AMB99723.1 hypothetical protein AWM75_06870 [Aerococcus urinaehominis]SDL91961.1 MarR family transcriptional regulator, 2-MHQ and catechol-resistance regulon repressor [Aerococcus urinaehominis]
MEKDQLDQAENKAISADSSSLHALRVFLQAQAHIMTLIYRDMRQQGLSENEFTVLELLYHKGSQPVQKIGRKIMIAGSSLTYVIDQLEKKQFVKRQVSDRDRRVIMVHITDEGREKMADIFPNHHHTIEKMFSVLSDEDLVEWVNLLKKVGFNAETLSQECPKK